VLETSHQETKGRKVKNNVAFRWNSFVASSVLLSVLFLFVDFFAQADVLQGLVGNWRFDETSATTAADSGGGNNGTLVNMESGDWVTGKLANALDFDGTNEYVNMGDPANGSLDFGTGNFTISAWIKADTTQIDSNRSIVNKGAVASGDAGYWFHLNSSGNLKLQIGNGSTLESMSVSPAVDLRDNQWHHVVVVASRSSEKFYIDGVAKSKTGSISSINVSTGFAFNVGGQGTANSYSGLIDDVRVYNRALTADEATNLFLEATPLFSCTQPVPVPTTDVTYYVAINQSGASNTACDGLYPTNQGGGHCPFKDFTSANVRQKLSLDSGGNLGTKSVTVKVRAGTYQIHPLEIWGPLEPLQPLPIVSDATNAQEPVVLTNYNSEVAILDGTCPTSFSTCNYQDAPGKIWSIVETYGDHVYVQGLKFINAYSRNIQIGSTNTHVRCNNIIGPYGSDSDSIKAATDQGPVYIYSNAFSGPNEQAIDGTLAHSWFVDNNSVTEGGGFGFKFNAVNVFIRQNSFTDLSLNKPALDFGGHGSSQHPGQYEAYWISATDNLFDGVLYPVEFAHCYNCTFNSNYVKNAEIGVNLGELDTGGDGCQNGQGCLDSTGARVYNNRFKNISSASYDNLFVLADPAEIADLLMGNNIYCVPSGQSPRFWNGGSIITSLSAWQSATGTDDNSQVLASTNSLCTSW
jgi:hypothetical protein